MGGTVNGVRGGEGAGEDNRGGDDPVSIHRAPSYRTAFPPCLWSRLEKREKEERHVLII